MTTIKEKSSLAKVMKNLNKEIKGIKNNSLKGKIKAAAFLRTDMDKTEPKIPVDTNNMRGSWFIEPVFSLNTVICGFNANYTFFVHENIGAVFQRPGAGAKFFQAAIERNYSTLLKLIKEENTI